MYHYESSIAAVAYSCVSVRLALRLRASARQGGQLPDLGAAQKIAGKRVDEDAKPGPGDGRYPAGGNPEDCAAVGQKLKA